MSSTLQCGGQRFVSPLVLFANMPNPRVFFDMEIGGRRRLIQCDSMVFQSLTSSGNNVTKSTVIAKAPAGRIEMELFAELIQ